MEHDGRLVGPWATAASGYLVRLNGTLAQVGGQRAQGSYGVVAGTAGAAAAVPLFFFR